MLEPTVSPRPSVVALAASIVSLSLVLGGCRGDPAEPPGRAPTTAPAPPVAAPAAPAPVAALDRAGLLAAIDVAASAYASGVAPEGASLSGRRFVVRQAFGCIAQPATALEAIAEDGVATWSRSADGKNLKVALTPSDWIASPLITDGDEPGWEAVEGVWLTRPWLKAGGCPRVPTSDRPGGPAAQAPQTAGLASVFEADGSRLGRRNGRAYEHTVRGDGDQPAVAPAQGYRLVLEGRMAAFPEGRSIRCRASGPDQRPVCIAAVQIDRVAFEDAGGSLLSEWRDG